MTVHGQGQFQTQSRKRPLEIADEIEKIAQVFSHLFSKFSFGDIFLQSDHEFVEVVELPGCGGFDLIQEPAVVRFHFFNLALWHLMSFHVTDCKAIVE